MGDCQARFCEGLRVKLPRSTRQRFWRNVKYECIYLDRPENGAELLQCLSVWFDRYNRERPHQSLKYQTPENVYYAAA